MDAETLGEPQLKTIKKYAEYIKTIAQARDNTFEQIWREGDRNVYGWENLKFWDDVVIMNQELLDKINEVLEKETLGL